MTEQFTQQAEQKMAALEKWLLSLFAKAPHLPEGGRKTLIDIVPWLALIFGALGVFGIVTGGSFISVFSMSFLGFGFGQFSFLLTLAAELAAAVLGLLAYQPLMNRSKRGWNYLFYGVVITAAVAVVNMIFGFGYGMGSQVFSTLVGLWLLFEIRSAYR